MEFSSFPKVVPGTPCVLWEVTPRFYPAPYMPILLPLTIRDFGIYYHVGDTIVYQINLKY
jgi:hypothetical protein